MPRRRATWSSDSPDTPNCYMTSQFKVRKETFHFRKGTNINLVGLLWFQDKMHLKVPTTANGGIRWFPNEV